MGRISRFSATRFFVICLLAADGLAGEKNGARETKGPDADTAAAATPDQEGSTPDLATVKLVQEVQQPPLQPAPATLDFTPPATGTGLSQAIFGSRGTKRSLLSTARRARSNRLSSDVVLGAESKFRVTTDTGNLLGESLSATGLRSKRRAPIITNNRVRGTGLGSLLASGSFWFPARPDLDTLLSKIDSRIIADTIIVKGPYAARYGPGFAFVDIGLTPAPRYDQLQWHGSSSLEYKTNGEQWYGRETIWGGGPGWGMRIGYGHRTGSDYEAGNGDEFIASYKSRDLDVALGFDLSADSRIEFSYLRLDQTDVEVVTQLLDLNFLVTDAFEVTYIIENQCHFDAMTVEGWYNRTRLEGDVNGTGKRLQVPGIGLNGVTVESDANNMSTGFSWFFDWGIGGDCQTTMGVDLRYLTQEINGFTTNIVFPPPGILNNNSTPQINGPLPDAYSANPGLFLEHVRPLSDTVVINTGGRFDLVDTNASTRVKEVGGSSSLNGLLYNPSGRPVQVTPGVFVPGTPANLEDLLGGDFNQSFTLGSFYLTGEYELDACTKANAGFAFAMRAPTMAELYPLQLSATVLPQSTSSVLFGNPNLKSEKRYQVDTGLAYDNGPVRSGVSLYHAWIEDYITLDAAIPLTSFLYQYVNTDLATLAGVDLYAEYDLHDCLTAFGTMSFVEGRDHTRDGNPVNAVAVGRVPGTPRSGSTSDHEPLPNIAPLESRVGLRYRDSLNGRWGMEISARIVDNQDRVALTMSDSATPGFTTYDVRGFWRMTDCLTVIAGIENLTDKTYQQHLDPHGRIAFVPPPFVPASTGNVLQPGINFYLGFEMLY